MSIVENKIVEKDATEYEAPCVESVIEAEDIEREVAYAGVVAASGFAPA